jgi:hypothetical protein
MNKLINEGDENDLLLKFTFTVYKVRRSNIINIILRSNDSRTIPQEFDFILHAWIPKIIKLTMENNAEI